MSKKMTKDAARRIQSHADKTGTNQDWKARAMSAADRNTSNGKSSGSNSDSNSGGKND